MNTPTPEAVRAAFAYVERSRDGWFFEIQPFREGCETSADCAARILAAALRQRDDDRALAERIVRNVFACGSDPGLPCTRIEFKAERNGHEHPMGGFAKKPLVDFIEKQIADFRKQPPPDAPGENK